MQEENSLKVESAQLVTFQTCWDDRPSKLSQVFLKLAMGLVFYPEIAGRNEDQQRWDHPVVLPSLRQVPLMDMVMLL